MSDDKKAILAVLAHPDDESFGMGGTLALYAHQGTSVHLVCATRGEAGVVDPEYLQGYTSIAARREAELRCAAEKLGLTSVHFLDYRDSGMPGSQDNYHQQALIAAPVEEVAGKIAGYIRRLQPQVLLTFDPIGGYKHPDHIMVNKATVRAFELAGQASFESALPPYQPAKLYFQVFSWGFLRHVLRLLVFFHVDLSRFGRNRDIDVTKLIEESNFPVHARISCRSMASQKYEASLCHASQFWGVTFQRGPIRWLQYLMGTTEHYMRAFPPADPDLKERDLFEGLGQRL
ncbi:MAG: PIG-L family deacetylase [Anaerolineales bacterium]|nr:MAG: PIG-L family deacetylase [Anaerolineales bacterium]